jgi:hypothetical protein
MIKLILALLTLVSLVSCAVLPLNFEPRPINANSRFDRELKRVSVEFSKAVNMTSDYQSAVIQNWQTSLEKSLDKGGFFHDNSTKKSDLLVSIKDFDAGSMYLEVKIIAEYKLLDRESGKAIYQAEFYSKATDETFYGNERFVKILNKAISENIEKFLTELTKEKLRNSGTN